MMRAMTMMAAALLAAPAAAQDAPGARDRATVLMSEHPRGRAFQEEYGYADAVVIDGTAYLSGVIVGQRPGETLVQAYDRTFRQIGAILQRAGTGWRDVVEITSYHTDIAAQLKPMAEAKKSYITPPHPAWTAIGVTRLAEPSGLTEIKLIARLAPKR